MIISALNCQYKINSILLVTFIFYIHFFWYGCHIIYFLFCYCLGINEIQTVKIDVFVDVIILINLIKQLPCNIIIYLLLHLLILLKSYLFFILFVSICLVFFVNFMLQTIADFFIFIQTLFVSVFQWFQSIFCA